MTMVGSGVRKAGRSSWLVVTGVKEIDRALKRLVPAIQKKVVRQAMRKAVKPIQQEAKSNAPVRTGALKMSIQVRAMKRKVGRIGISVVTSVGGDYKGKTWYGSLQEFGWKHGKRRGGKRGREIEGKHFMKRAFDTLGPAAKVNAERWILAGAMEQVKALRTFF